MYMNKHRASFFNRWDSQLFLSLAAHPLDLSTVSAGIFDRAAPPPNQSTQCQPLSSANFLHEVDKVRIMNSL